MDHSAVNMDHSEVKHLPKVDHTPAELDEASKLLLKTADLIETGGLCKHALHNEHGAHCTIGALLEAGRGTDWSKAAQRFYAALGQEIAAWNNAPERTQAEVVSKLRAVALGL